MTSTDDHEHFGDYRRFADHLITREVVSREQGEAIICFLAAFQQTQRQIGRREARAAVEKAMAKF